MKEYLEAAQEHADARVLYAQEYQRAFFVHKNSYVATQIATDKCKDRITLTAAALKVAEERMMRE